MQQGLRKHYDVIIIGSGIAGLSCAIELHHRSPHCKILILVKDELKESNSLYAQGGIASAVQSHASIQLHINDTLKAGAGLCNQPNVEQIIASGPNAIDFLISQGTRFDKNDCGYNLTQEGGHAKRRIYHAKDITGKEIIDSLTQQVTKLPNVEIAEYHIAVNLITLASTHHPQSLPRVVGVYTLEQSSQMIHTLFAKQIILATGGAGKVYRYTSNPDVATGDGIAMAYRAGARVGNMEFFQFHPTLLYHENQKNFLISEALRGEGGRLILPDTHQPFMHQYAPQEQELATRDIVSRAIFTEIESSGNKFVYLDMRHHSQTWLEQRFPKIFQTLASLGINMHCDLIPVVPAAHYLCGGVLTDATGQTDLPGLFAIGETAFSGLHGANRLASNSLLEGVVMARLAAQSVAEKIKQPMPKVDHILNWSSKSVVDLRRASQISAHWRGLRGEMTSYAGIIRTAAGLKDLLKLISTRAEMIEEYYWNHFITKDLIELRNIVLIAKLIVESALQRQESRGGHYRADYPNLLDTPMESFLRINNLHSRVFNYELP